MRIPRNLPSPAPRAFAHLLPRQFEDDAPEEPTIETNTTSLSLPVILTITFLTLATLFTLLVTVYCILSRQLAARARARPSDMPSPSPAPSIEVLDVKTNTQQSGSKKKRRRKDVPTLVFRQHEPEKYGFFAPLYFSRWRRGGDGGDGVKVEDVKEDLARVFEPSMLERGNSDEERMAVVAGRDETKSGIGSSPVAP